MLRLAWQQDGDAPRGAFGALHGVRAMGCTITGKHINPPADSTPEEWDAEKTTWLAPHRDVIAGLLKAAS